MFPFKHQNGFWIHALKIMANVLHAPVFIIHLQKNFHAVRIVKMMICALHYLSSATSGLTGRQEHERYFIKKT